MNVQLTRTTVMTTLSVLTPLEASPVDARRGMKEMESLAMVNCSGNFLFVIAPSKLAYQNLLSR